MVGVMKKVFDDPTYRPNKAEHYEKYQKIQEDLEKAIEQIPMDLDGINRVMFIITDPKFEYPHVKPCCNQCTAEESNIQWAKAIDILKTIEGKTNPEDIKEIYEKGMLQFSGGLGYFQ